MYWNSK